MKRFEPIKIYILQNGKTEPYPGKDSASPAQYHWLANIIRDKRKLLCELSRRGDVYLSFKEKHFKLSSKQIQMICGLRKNLEFPRQKSCIAIYDDKGYLFIETKKESTDEK